MKKIFTVPVILSGIILVLAVVLIATLLIMKQQQSPVRGIAPLFQIAPMEPDSELWGRNFPNQYSTLKMTATNNTRTTYGGSEQVEKTITDPLLKILFAGNAFAKGYADDRGHANAVADVRNTPRINDKTPATCYSCKSSNNPKLWDEMGMAAYDATSFADLSSKIQHSIGCANCHEANTMRLIVTNPALDEALKAQGKDWRTFSRQEMRTMVCANCHVEYYFKGDGKYLTLPWAKGTRIENIEAYYEEIKFSDFTHAEDGTKIIKMQHPDYELYTAGSTHYNAGVACADCHMPYTRDGSAKFSTHNVRSPLLDPSSSCGACHTDVNSVVARVNTIQNNTNMTMMKTEAALVDAINAIKAAAANPSADAAKVEEARKLHRAAQARWDFIAAENSMGFHNGTEALRILADATDMARQAQTTAIQATLK
jgi:nitrite reductase (cytochrome c-552)